MNDLNKQLSFLTSPTQGEDNRITDRETTIRLLIAIFYQANLADTYDCDDKQEWQTPKMIGVCNLIQDALRLLDAEDVLEDMINSGSYTFCN
jgi:hypothetical protein